MLSLSLIVNVLLTICTCAKGWSGGGHREVARHAYRHTSSKGKKFLKAHGFEDIESFKQASQWADSEDALAEYPRSGELHFSHTPWRNCQPFSFERDCGYGGSGQCIVSGIADMLKLAISPSTDLKSRTDAIKFITHLMADIHQPLHTGFREDAGGVHINVELDSVSSESRTSLSLHQLWDYELFEYQGGVESVFATIASSSVAAAADITDDLTVPKPEELNGQIFAYAAALASESSQLFTCKYAYQFDNGEYVVDHVTRDYLASRSIIAAERLRTAGKRLAHLIDSMAHAFYNTETAAAGAAAAGAGAATPHTSKASENYFAVLRLDFDPNEFLSNITAPQTNTSTLETRSGAGVPTNASTRVCGRKVSYYVLVNLRDRFTVTCRHFLATDPAYVPLHVMAIKVKFSVPSRRVSANIPVVFWLDPKCFQTLDYSEMRVDEFVRLLLHFKGIAHDHEDVSRFIEEQSLGKGGAGAVAGSSKMNMMGVDRKPRNPPAFEGGKLMMAADPLLSLKDSVIARHRRKMQNQIAEMTSGNFTTLDEKWAMEIKRAFPKTIRVVTEKFNQVYLHIDTILDPTKTDMKFLIFNSIDPRTDDKFKVLIDTSIYDGPMTHESLDMIRAVARKDHIVMGMIAARRRTLPIEVGDIDMILEYHTANPFNQRGFRNDRLKIIQHFLVYESSPDGPLSDQHHIIEYSLSTEPAALKRT